jgi:hypothetical protein
MKRTFASLASGGVLVGLAAACSGGVAPVETTGAAHAEPAEAPARAARSVAPGRSMQPIGDAHARIRPLGACILPFGPRAASTTDAATSSEDAGDDAGACPTIDGTSPVGLCPRAEAEYEGPEAVCPRVDGPLLEGRDSPRGARHRLHESGATSAREQRPPTGSWTLSAHEKSRVYARADFVQACAESSLPEGRGRPIVRGLPLPESRAPLLANGDCPPSCRGASARGQRLSARSWTASTRSYSRPKRSPRPLRSRRSPRWLLA